MLPIVEHIARTQPQRPVIVAHADRRAQDHALRDTVLHLGREIDDFTSYTWYETIDEGDTRSRQGFIDLSDIPLPNDIQVFTCGPLPFMRLVRSTLLDRGVPPARIRYEVFGPDLWAAQTAPDSGVLTSLPCALGRCVSAEVGWPAPGRLRGSNLGQPCRLHPSGREQCLDLGSVDLRPRAAWAAR